MEYGREETFETLLAKVVVDMVKESRKTESEKIRERLDKFIGRFGMTPYGVGHCLKINMKGKCQFNIPGLGHRNVKLDEVVW